MLRRAKGESCDKHWRPNEPFVKVHLKVCPPFQPIALFHRPSNCGSQKLENQVFDLCLLPHVHKQALSVRIIVQARHGCTTVLLESITLAL